MKLNELRYSAGSCHCSKRPGHGTGSGIGETSGNSMKGQTAHSGGGVECVLHLEGRNYNFP